MNRQSCGLAPHLGSLFSLSPCLQSWSSFSDKPGKSVSLRIGKGQLDLSLRAHPDLQSRRLSQLCCLQGLEHLLGPTVSQIFVLVFNHTLYCFAFPWDLYKAKCLSFCLILHPGERKQEGKIATGLRICLPQESASVIHPAPEYACVANREQILTWKLLEAPRSEEWLNEGYL